jgi:hypothetical protein
LALQSAFAGVAVQFALHSPEQVALHCASHSPESLSVLHWTVQSAPQVAEQSASQSNSAGFTSHSASHSPWQLVLQLTDGTSVHIV